MWFPRFVHDGSVWLHDPDKEIVCFRIIVFLNLVTQIVHSRDVHVGQERLGDLTGEIGALRFDQMSQMPSESPKGSQRECQEHSSKQQDMVSRQTESDRAWIHGAPSALST